MEAPEAISGTSEVRKSKSPSTSRPASPLRTPSSDSDSVSSSPNLARKESKEKSPKVKEHKSPKSPISEKRADKNQESESLVAQLKEDLKIMKDQLDSSESRKKQAQKEAEEANKKVLALSKELEESQRNVLELSASEEQRLQKLQKNSEELEAIQKKHSVDSTALASAMNEIQKLKTQLERVLESEASHISNAESANAEIHNLRTKLDETLSLVERLKNEVNDCKESESKTVETLRLEGIQVSEAYKSLALELEQSRAQVKSLEELVNKLEADESNIIEVNDRLVAAQATNFELEAELSRLKVELDQGRKEAQATAAMRSIGNKGNFVDRHGSLDNAYNSSTAKISSPYSEVTNDHLAKKKHTSIFKKIGEVWESIVMATNT